MYRISTERLIGTFKYLQPAKSFPYNLTIYIRLRAVTLSITLS